MVRVILFGNMCSGKTSVGRFLAEGLGDAVVSAKDAIARNLASASAEVLALRATGHLLPDPVISGWVLGAVAEQVARGRRVILDGFPRTEGQARALLAAHGTESCVVHCDFTLPVLERRFVSRVLCSGCELPTSTAFEDFDARCALCGGSAFAPRPTDRPGYMAVKTAQYQSESLKVLPVLRAAGLRFHSTKDHTRLGELRAEVATLAVQLEADHGH